MKNIYKISFLIALTMLIFTSCAVDDDGVVVNTNTTVTAALTAGTEPIIVPLSTTPYEVGLSLSAPFTNDAQAQYTINGVGETSSIDAGATSSNISLDVSDYGSYSVVLNNVLKLYDPEVSITVDSDNNSATIVVADVPAVDVDNLQISLAWTDADNNDLDLWGSLGEGVSGIVFDTSQSISALEQINLPNANADGGYEIYVRNWVSVLDPIPFSLVAVHPDGTTEVFVSDVPNIDLQFNLALKIVKTGSTYAITQVNPTTPIQ